MGALYCIGPGSHHNLGPPLVAVLGPGYRASGLLLIYAYESLEGIHASFEIFGILYEQ